MSNLKTQTIRNFMIIFVSLSSIFDYLKSRALNAGFNRVRGIPHLQGTEKQRSALRSEQDGEG